MSTIKEEIKSQDLVTQKDLFEVQSALEKNILEAKLELEMKIAALRTDLIKWALGIGSTSCILLIGAMATLFQLFLHTA